MSSDAANIGAVSWTYQAMKGNNGALGLDGGPLFNGWRGMSGEADLGLFGAIKLLSSDVAVDPIFGLYGYGCDVSESGGNYTVVPKDGVFQRLNLITEKLGMILERDRIAQATVAKTKNGVSFTLTNASPGTYNVTVNNIASGSFTAVNGQTAIASLNIGTAATYTVSIQPGTAVPVSCVIANYNMNQTTGTTVTDSSSAGNHATLSGPTSWITGRSGAGNALGLNGSNAFATLPTGVVSSLNDFTISAWVRVTANSDWARIFDFGSGTGTYMFLAPQSGGGGGARFAITTGGNGTEQQLTASSPLTVGQWKHVVVTLSGTTGRLYIDGVQVAINTNMTLKPSSLGATTQNYIGKSQYSDPYLNGAVDDFMIYSRALSTAEVSSLYGGATIQSLSLDLTDLPLSDDLSGTPEDEQESEQVEEHLEEQESEQPEEQTNETPSLPDEVQQNDL